ncbi:MAG: hypothetical protein M1813_000679 [Trichoglossum hirsutum]|nr:MAG: hypothetical protein M1813_000679 [Trichoglossum hirsutum]
MTQLWSFILSSNGWRPTTLSRKLRGGVPPLAAIFTNNNYYNSISNANPGLCCLGLDLGKVKNAYEELGIRGLPIVMFFKGGEKIGEVIGCVPPEIIRAELGKSMPDLKILETIGKNTGEKEKRQSASDLKIPKATGKNIKTKGEEYGGCEVCQLERIAKSLDSHPSDGMVHNQHKISVHKLTANIERCKQCEFLTETCRRDLSLFEHVESVGGEIGILSKRDKGLARLDLEGPARKRGIRNTDRFKSRILQKGVNETQEDSAHFSGRSVQSEADFGLYRKWLACCREYHSKACCVEAADLAKMKLRLINIDENRVVEASRDDKYAALSYVWGVPDQLKLVKKTVPRLTSVGGLSEDFPDVPKTIRDAMSVAAKLGSNYLWVDALCIVQDDEEDVPRQMKQMDKIYGCATFTIVSTGLNVDAGIPGLSPRTPNQIGHEIGDIQLINSLPTLSQALSTSEWDYRGWTLQEKALSRRLLIFTESQAYWHCNSAIYAEDTNLELLKDARSLSQIVEHYEEYSDELRRTYKPSPTNSVDYQYNSLLRSYMTRSLTKQCDAINAFTGVLNILEDKLGSPHQGLPSLKFDGAMLWQIDGHFPDSRRNEFPSWSWAGWEGSKGVRMDEGGLETLSKISWWKSNDASGKWEKINLDQTAETDSGYTNEFFGVNSSLPPPRPTSDNMALEGNPKHPPQSHLLRFWTSIARLTIGRTSIRTRGEACFEYPVYVPGQNQRISTIVLDETWRKGRGDEFDVIFLSRTGEGYKFKYDIKIWTMVIEWKGDVANRVQLFVFPIRLLDWEAAKPRFELITLA